MIVEVNQDLQKAVKKLSKLKFLTRTSSPELKKDLVFLKNSSLKRQIKIEKMKKIDLFKKLRKNTDSKILK